MQRSRKAWVVLWLGLWGCSLATDFPRDKIQEGPDGDGGSDAMVWPEASVDGTVGMDATSDTGMDAQLDTGADAIVDTGPQPDVPANDCTSNDQCASNQLCCNGLCVATSVNQCTGCGVGCDVTAANTCNGRSCGCDSANACGGNTPFCVANGAGASSCAECNDNSQCASRSDGKTQCIGGRCAACNPEDNSGCSGNTPVCSRSSLTCVGCTMGSNDCKGNTVCTASGACGGCDDSGDCATPTTPICNMTANPTVCRGCASDQECVTEKQQPYCSSDQRCGPCKPVANNVDPGCEITSATPACVLPTGQTQYQCQRCTANAQCAGGGVRNLCNTAASGATAGRCVECTGPAQCTDPAKPFCDASGLCQPCSAATVPNDYCASIDTVANPRPFCDATSGRCVECTTTEGCSTGTNRRCYLHPTNPSLNDCVECTQRADCSGNKPVCEASTHTCRACAVATEALDCTAASPLTTPACGPNGACVVCRRGGASACSGTNGTCSATNTCVDCFGASEGCAAGEQCKGGSSATPMCVDCTDNSGCTAPAQCHTGSNTCVPCLAPNLGCTSPTTPICLTNNNPAMNRCVACIMPTDCGAPPNACTQNLCMSNVCSTQPIAGINDGVGCTDDACDVGTGAITHMRNNANCTNADMKACTVPTCDPSMTSAASGCIELPDHAMCADTLDCTTDACVGAGGDANGCQFIPACPPGQTCQVGGCMP